MGGINNTKFNIVKFAGAAIELESPWKMSTGLKPDTNCASCTYREYANLPAVGTHDKLEFFFSADNSADLTIRNVILQDVEPALYGSDAAQLGAWKVIKYRLVFTDSRAAFVDPRGGRLIGGVINPSTETPSDPDRTHVPAVQKMDDLITACIRGMGITCSAPSTSVEAPKDLKWFGTHAATELEKLLGMSDMVFALQPDGTYGIFNRNDGNDPTIPSGRQLPTLTTDGADARATTVVFASYPTQITNTLTQDDLDDGDLKHVYRNEKGAWQGIDDCGVFGDSAIDEMNGHFSHTPDPQDQSGCYRYVRLNPDRFDPVNSPILRKTYHEAGDTDSDNPNGLPAQIDIVVKAMIAVQDPANKQWKMPDEKVQIAVDRVHDGNVFGFSSRLVKLKTGVTATTDLEGNCEAIDLDTDIKIRFSVGAAPWDDSQQEFIPDYFYVGFTGDPASPGKIGSDDCKAKLTDPQTIVVPVHELVAMRTGMTGDPVNLSKLQDQMQAFAGRYLKDTAKPPRLLAGAGFIPFTFNGRIAEVEIDQSSIATRFKVDAWFRPAGSYLAQAFSNLRKPKESHPHEAKSAGTRAAQGAAASAAPVQPMTPYFPPPAASSDFIPVLLVQTGGAQSSTVGGSDFPPSWRYTVKSLDGTVLALDVPLYTLRIGPLSTFPAGTGIACYAPQLTVVSNGTTPDGTGPTPIRLWHADEMLMTDESCVPFTDDGSSSSGG